MKYLSFRRSINDSTWKSCFKRFLCMHIIIIITFFLLFSYHYLFNKNKSCTKAVFLKLLLYCYGVILLNSFISSNCDLLIITRQIIIFSYILKKYSNFIGFWGHNMLNYYITRANLIMIDYYYAIKLWFLS